MAFLDNSGDIILDAVLTDTGRMRLAKGDGSFRIVKFALADDEINYTRFDKNASGGTAYYDLEILQTPLLEAFTNNGSTMNNKLISISRNNLLYLPVLKVNDIEKGAGSNYANSSLVSQGYVLLADYNTETYFTNSTLTYAGSNALKGLLNGYSTSTGENIRVDQGLNTIEIPPDAPLDPDLKETQFMVEIDNRFGSLVSADNRVNAVPSFIDDDNIATYYFSLGVDTSFVEEITTANTGNGTNVRSGQVISGPKGNKLEFKIKSSTDVSTSTYLFDTLGTSLTVGGSGFNVTTGVTSIKSILTNITVTGVTTGYSIDIPVLLVKKT